MSRRLGVVIPTAGSVYVEVEVEDDFDETDLDAVYDAALNEIEGRDDIEHAWDYHRRIARCVHTNEVGVISDTAAG